MIWTMNENLCKSPSSSSFQEALNLPHSIMNENECAECLKHNNELNEKTSSVASHAQCAKRKRSQSPNSAKSSPRFRATESSEVGVGNESIFLGKIPKVDCPHDSNVNESTRTNLNKKELKLIRMQIAMLSDKDGDRPLHIAVAQQNLKLVRKLCAIMLKTAISLDLTNYLRQTALHLAVMLGNTEMITVLLKCGSSVSLRDRNGNSVIHLAIKTDANKEVMSLILSQPESAKILNALDYEGYTALHYAILRRNKTAVSCLHCCKADMNIKDGKSGRTPLIHAVMEQNTDMVSHLLDCGASIGMVDYSGRSAFDLALQTANSNIVKLLESKLIAQEFSHRFSSKAEELDETQKCNASKRTKKLKVSSAL